MSLYTLTQAAMAAMQKFVEIMTGDVTANVDLTSLGGGSLPSLRKALSMSSTLVFTGSNLPEVIVASADPLDLTGVTSPKVRVTGNVNITSIIGSPHSMYFLRFADGGLTITHNNATLMLPGADDIGIEAGDMMLITTMTSGSTVRCRQYTDVSERTDGSTDKGRSVSANASPFALKRGYNGVTNLVVGPLSCALPGAAHNRDGDTVVLKDEGGGAAIHELRLAAATGEIEGKDFLSITTNGGWRKVRWSDAKQAWFQVP